MKKMGFIFLAAVTLSSCNFSEKDKAADIETLTVPVNIKIGEVNDRVVQITKDGKAGYLDKKGEEILKPEWDGTKYYSRFNYISALKDNSIAVFDVNGKKILEKKDVVNIVPQEKELFLIINKDKKMGLESSTKEILPQEYDYIKNIGDNQYVVSKVNNANIKTGLIEVDSRGPIKKVLDMEYQGITKTSKDTFIVKKDNKLSAIKNVYEKNPIFFEINEAPIYYDSEKVISEHNGVHSLSFFTQEGKASYENIRGFLYKMAVVKENDKYGIIDEKGNVLLKPEYEFLEIAAPDLLVFKNNDKYGYIDKKGKEVIPAQYDEVTSFFGNRAMAIKDDEIKVIDKKGQIIEKAKYDVVSEIKDDVIIGGIETGFGAVNSKSDEIIKPIYDDMTFWGDKYIKGNMGEEIDILDYEGNVLLKVLRKDNPKFYNNQVVLGETIYFF